MIGLFYQGTMEIPRRCCSTLGNNKIPAAKALTTLQTVATVLAKTCWITTRLSGRGHLQLFRLEPSWKNVTQSSKVSYLKKRKHDFGPKQRNWRCSFTSFGKRNSFKYQGPETELNQMTFTSGTPDWFWMVWESTCRTQ